MRPVLARLLLLGALTVGLLGTGAGPAWSAESPAARRGVEVPDAVAPLPEPLRVAARFVAPSTPFGPGHRGVDLTAPVGTLVRAAGAGTVVAAGSVAGRGVVSVQHPSGWRTTYEPVLATVAPGASVMAGDVLGTLQGGHGSCLVACLHWGLRLGSSGADAEYRDPLTLLSRGPARLLPLGGGGVSGVLESARTSGGTSVQAARTRGRPGAETWAAGGVAGTALVGGLALARGSGRRASG